MSSLMRRVSDLRVYITRRLANAWAVTGITLVFGLCFSLVVGSMLLDLRAQAWRNSMREADNLLGALSQNLARNFALYDLSLQAVVDGLRLKGVWQMPPEFRNAILFDHSSTAEDLGRIVVLDAQGDLRLDSRNNDPKPANYSQREYFEAHRANVDLGLYISAPFARSKDGVLVISFSRRLNNEDGSFAGVVASSLNLSHLRAVFERFTLGENSALGLTRTDGTVLMRTPFQPALIGKIIGGQNLARYLAARKGTFATKTQLDGVDRVVSFSHVESLPLFVTVALSEQAIFAEWNARAAIIGLVLGAVCLAMAGLSALFSIGLRRRFRAEADVRDREAELRMLTDHATDVIIRLDNALIRRFVSPSSQSVLGFSPAELLGQSIEATIDPADWPFVLQAMEQARCGQEQAVACYRFLRRDGSFIWVEGQFGYMPSEGGFALVLRDISRRKAMEEALAEANKALSQMAVTDALTGLFNRRGFDDAAAREWRQAARDEQPMSLLMFDVDRFKQFNDLYGHQHGDTCLQAIAQAIHRCARRPSDVAARYGGEEFAVLLPRTDEIQALALAERVRREIEALEIEHLGNAAHRCVATSSIGVATCVPRQGHGDLISDMRAFIRAADEALYRAKSMGRNRVEVSCRELATAGVGGFVV